MTEKGPALTDWLDVARWVLLDIDDDGTVLATSDQEGTGQLFLVHPDRVVALTALSQPCTGRFAGPSTVIVQHDRNGNAQFDLSLLELTTDPVPATEDDLIAVTRSEGTCEVLMDAGHGWIAYMSNRRNRIDFDVVMRELSTGQERVLYELGGLVSQAHVGTSGAKPLSDAAVAVTVFTGQSFSTHLWLIETSGARQLSPQQRLGMHLEPRLDRTHQWLYVSTDTYSDRREVWRYDYDGTCAPILSDPDADLIAIPSPDGKLLAVLREQRGEVSLTICDSDGRKLAPIDLPSAGAAEILWSGSSQRLAVQLNTIHSPSELYVLDSCDWTPRSLLTASHPGSAILLRQTAAVAPEFTQVPTRDGLHIPCRIYRHPQFEGPRPAVVYLHGGPEANEVVEFSPLKQFLAHHGWIVIAPDVRGSTGYGRHWYELDDRHRRVDAIADLADIHRWLPTAGVDPDRVALVGASYGGYLTLCGLTFHPELWAAGVDIMGIASLVTYLENTPQYRRGVRECEYGYLDRDGDLLRSISPLYHADRIQAPLLMIHGEHDPRVPVTESRALADRLADTGTECELLVFADEGHSLSRRANRYESYQRIEIFLRRHLDPATHVSAQR